MADPYTHAFGEARLRFDLLWAKYEQLVDGKLDRHRISPTFNDPNLSPASSNATLVDSPPRRDLPTLTEASLRLQQRCPACFSRRHWGSRFAV